MGLRYLLVGNPTAQSGKAAARIRLALARMVERGMDARFVATEPEGRTVARVKDEVDRGTCDVVLYLGGDGTFAEVAKGILAAERRVPMGMLPSGTANDQGKSFGVRSPPRFLDYNLDVVARGHTVMLDAGRIERLDDAGGVTDSDLFFDSAGFGMHPTILMSRNRDRLRVRKLPLLGLVYRDHAVYAGAAVERYLRSYVEPVKFDAEIHADGRTRTYTGLVDLVVNATPIYGGIWVPARDAAPDDGRFEIAPLAGRRDMLSKMIRDLKDLPVWQEDLDKIGIRHAEGFSASNFDIVLLRPRGGEVASQIDGEEWVSGTHFRVKVLPNRLPLIVPEDFEPPWKPA